MRTSLALLAGLAGSALALPATSSTQLDTRTFGLINGILHTIESILSGVSPIHLLGNISAEAAVALQGGALGCAAGSVDLHYRKKLAIWLRAGAGLHLEASLRKALLAWCEADVSVDLEIDVDLRAQLAFFIPALSHIAAEADLYVTLEGVFEVATDALAVLSATAQAALEAHLALLGTLDWKIKAGLEFCAAGGIVGDLDVEIINALKVWLNGSECGLSVSLKKTLLLWIEGKIGGDVVAIGNLPTGGVATIGVGASLQALIGETGALVAGAQASLSAFLETKVGLEIDVTILNILKLIAKGGLAVDIELADRVELSLWLGSSSCSLTAELKGLLAFWLSFGVTAETDLSVSVHTNIVTELTGFLTGTIDTLLGTHIHGLLSFILGGEGVLSLSLEARAQLAALIGGGVGIEIDESIQLIIIGWLTGCQKCCGGSQVTHGPSSPSSTPALPASETPSVPAGTPAVPTGAQPTETPSVPAGTPGVPTDAQPSETPSVPAGTPGVPTDAQPSETPSVPTGTPAVPTDVSPTDTETPASPEETPCDTLTSESVTSYTVSTPGVPTDAQPTETPAAPTETPSVPEVPAETPAGPTETPAAPTETPEVPAESTETPCDTLTSESVTSYTVSTPGVPTDVQPTETPAVPTETPSVPEVPAETPAGPTETPAVPEVPAETPAGPTETSDVPAESETPCDTLTSESVTSYTVSETASVPAGTETPAAPTDVSPTDSETPAVPAQPTETPAVPTEAQPSETPCDTLTSESVTSYTVSETASVPAGTETPAAPTDVSPTDSETPAVPTEAQPSETPCDTLTTDSVTSYTVSETASVPAGTETAAVPTDVSPTETAAVPSQAQPTTISWDTTIYQTFSTSLPGVTGTWSTDITETYSTQYSTVFPVPTGGATCEGCAGVKTVTVTKTVGIEACPTDA
ncbi:putative cell wall protein [Aspergillus mulundensis]|uniref:Cell wall protein n=1 Tax=Aspergillus mulundensis TaxID=1810919 RepID=A0A3D8SKE2_9EURO|nr:hypothetical protein DSM5745_03283 [Aspergillus mulundensis]RDW86641.1 hypothetical protein DSM5745_03283 [Aspergillus mulundensis]